MVVRQVVQGRIYTRRQPRPKTNWSEWTQRQSSLCPTSALLHSLFSFFFFLFYFFLPYSSYFSIFFIIIFFVFFPFFITSSFCCSRCHRLRRRRRRCRLPFLLFLFILFSLSFFFIFYFTYSFWGPPPLTLAVCSLLFFYFHTVHTYFFFFLFILIPYPSTYSSTFFFSHFSIFIPSSPFIILFFPVSLFFNFLTLYSFYPLFPFIIIIFSSSFLLHIYLSLFCFIFFFLYVDFFFLFFHFVRETHFLVSLAPPVADFPSALSWPRAPLKSFFIFFPSFMFFCLLFFYFTGILRTMSVVYYTLTVIIHRVKKSTKYSHIKIKFNYCFINSANECKIKFNFIELFTILFLEIKKDYNKKINTYLLINLTFFYIFVFNICVYIENTIVKLVMK